MTVTRIKICGIRDAATAMIAVEAGADALGVVLAAGSARTVSLETGLAIVTAVPREIPVFAVVRHDDPPWAVLAPWPGPIQLHGRWRSEECRDPSFDGRSAIKESPTNPMNGMNRMIRINRIIRGMPWSAESVLEADAVPTVAALLIDGPEGGSGIAFDHRELLEILPRLAKPVIIAGGLRAETVASVVTALRPYAVDVSSGVESAPGVKDAASIRTFCTAVRSAGR